MMLLAVGCNFRTAGLDLRERLAFKDSDLPKALDALSVRYGCETVILNTCNRVELYFGRAAPEAPKPRPTEGPKPRPLGPGDAFDAGLIAEFLAEWHHLRAEELRGHLDQFRDGEAVRHLFRVAASLDSMIVGEGQIAGQVKDAYDLAQKQGTVGGLLHALFQHARLVAKRVRTETGIAQGHVSISSAAVAYVGQVFERFDDKTVLVIGAGKMGELTLKHLSELKPKRIWVTNRSPEKAQAVAAGCGGVARPWEQLDDALLRADIVLSTTGSPEPIVTRERWQRILACRTKGSVVILDIAVPRDFDPDIHDGERTILINIDDLHRLREQTLRERQKHIAPAEAIVEQEAARFLKEWQRRKHGPLIGRLTQEFEERRRAALRDLAQRHNGELSAELRADIEAVLRRETNQLLHIVIKALEDDRPESGSSGLLEAVRKLFRLQE
jgi:glutamyl-tRNA reductase